jgi:formate-dependent nitrite reductase membrane component NrfD
MIGYIVFSAIFLYLLHDELDNWWPGTIAAFLFLFGIPAFIIYLLRP